MKEKKQKNLILIIFVSVIAISLAVYFSLSYFSGAWYINKKTDSNTLNSQTFDVSFSDEDNNTLEEKYEFSVTNATKFNGGYYTDNSDMTILGEDTDQFFNYVVHTLVIRIKNEGEIDLMPEIDIVHEVNWYDSFVRGMLVGESVGTVRADKLTADRFLLYPNAPAMPNYKKYLKTNFDSFVSQTKLPSGYDTATEAIKLDTINEYNSLINEEVYSQKTIAPGASLDVMIVLWVDYDVIISDEYDQTSHGTAFKINPDNVHTVKSSVKIKIKGMQKH